jgi:hypothetical protein
MIGTAYMAWQVLSGKQSGCFLGLLSTLCVAAVANTEQHNYTLEIQSLLLQLNYEPSICLRNPTTVQTISCERASECCERKPWHKEPAACSKFGTKDCVQSGGSANWNLNLHQKTLTYEVEQLSVTHNLTTPFNYKIVMLKNVLTFMFHTIKVQILSQLDKNPVSQTIKK